MAREPRERRDREERDSEFIDKLVHINRVAKVVKGGRRFGFAALVVVGDQKGRVGFGHGKAREVPEAIRKATDAAKRGLIRVPLREGRTLHHDVLGRHGAGKVYPARGASRHRHHRRRPDARRVRDARHAGRGGEVARLVQPLQHGARDLRRAQAPGLRRARSRRGATSRYRRCRRAAATLGESRAGAPTERVERLEPGDRHEPRAPTRDQGRADRQPDPAPSRPARDADRARAQQDRPRRANCRTRRRRAA